MSCVKEDGSCIEDEDESGSGDPGSGYPDEHNIVCPEGTVSYCFHAFDLNVRFCFHSQVSAVSLKNNLYSLL